MTDPIKTCDYCYAVGVMPTFMDGETVCYDCLPTLPKTMREARSEIVSLRTKIEQMEKQRPAAEWFDWLPQGTTHISRIRSVTIPCFGLEARFNAFKYIDGVLYTYRTDTDNEYGEWVKAAPRYRDGGLPTVYPISGAKGEEK